MSRGRCALIVGAPTAIGAAVAAVLAGGLAGGAAAPSRRRRDSTALAS